MIRLLLLFSVIQLTVSHPVPDAQIYFPDDNVPLEPRSSYSQHPSQGGHRTYYTKTSSYRKTGGYHAPVQWPNTAEGSDHQYGTSGHHAPYSSYGQHPHHLSYSSHSYGPGHPSGQAHTYESHSYGGSHNSGGSVEGQIEQISHGGSHQRAEHGPQYEVHSWQESGSHASQHGQPERVDEQEHHGGQHTSETRYVDEGRSPAAESSYGQHREEHVSETHKVDEGKQPAAGSSYGQHREEHVSETRQVDEAKKISAAEIAAEEHQIVKEIEELAGITSFPGEVTKNPITLQQEIIREIDGLAEPNREKNTAEHGTYEGHRESAVESGVNHETTIPPVRHHESTNNDRDLGESQVHHKEVVETPAVKVTSDQESLSGHHQVSHTATREEISHGSSSHKNSSPDPLDLMNIYSDYLHGDFKPGQPKEPAREPKKELKPEIKQAIENIMRDWEVLPDHEGKPQPPPRNFKVTKHVKVTHNYPVVVQPSQTITKTVKTHTFHPSTSHHQVVTHHINIAELLEQLRQLESSPHHRNVTWCEEKIKEFLTELNRKEESGIEIDQSVQEETLHHILTQDQTITKEVHSVIEHDASGGVKEEPFVKKTVVELGLHEPTKPPTYWEEHETKHETHDNSEGEPKEETVAKENEPKELEYGTAETSAEPSQEPDETHVIHVTQSPHHVPPLESLSHQTHTSTEINENVEDEKDDEKKDFAEHNEIGDDMEPHGSEPEKVTVAPVQPTPERPDEVNVEEFRGETEKLDRPLPPNYKPRENSEEKNDSENSELEKGNEVGSKEEHKRIEDLSIELPENAISHEDGEEHKNVEKEEGDTKHHSQEILKEEEGKEGSYGQKEEEHVVHETSTGEHSGGAHTEYTEETLQHSSEGGHGGEIKTEHTEETMQHHSGGSHGHSGGANTEYVEETVEHHNSGGSPSEGGSYVEETIEHSSGSHGHSGGSQTEYTEETVEHHSSGGSHEINYDQLIEELISLESLPGHQAIDKCEEKIRQFLEVLRTQQERGFDENKVELERLRHLIEEMQAQRQKQVNDGVTPNPEASASFWKKIGRKIKSTFEKAKTKAHDTVNGIMN